MGCEVRASMDVIQVGEALGLPVWLDRIASEAVNNAAKHSQAKGISVAIRSRGGQAPSFFAAMSIVVVGMKPHIEMSSSSTTRHNARGSRAST